MAVVKITGFADAGKWPLADKPDKRKDALRALKIYAWPAVSDAHSAADAFDAVIDQKLLPDVGAVVPPPEEITNPLTGTVFDNPVVASNGMTYERNHLTARFDSGDFTDPYNPKQALQPWMIENILLMDIIRQWKGRQQR